MQHEGVTCLRTHPTAAALQLSGGRASRAWWRAASSLCPCCGSRDSCDRGECGRGSRVEGEEERQEVGGGKLVYQRGLIMETYRKPLRRIFHDVTLEPRH